MSIRQRDQAMAQRGARAGPTIRRYSPVTRSRARQRALGDGDAGRNGLGRDFVNAAGYPRRRGRSDGRPHLPIVSMEHQYLVTEDVPALVSLSPRDPDELRDPDP